MGEIIKTCSKKYTLRYNVCYYGLIKQYTLKHNAAKYIFHFHVLSTQVHNKKREGNTLD